MGLYNQRISVAFLVDSSVPPSSWVCVCVIHVCFFSHLVLHLERLSVNHAALSVTPVKHDSPKRSTSSSLKQYLPVELFKYVPVFISTQVSTRPSSATLIQRSSIASVVQCCLYSDRDVWSNRSYLAPDSWHVHALAGTVNNSWRGMHNRGISLRPLKPCQILRWW